MKDLVSIIMPNFNSEKFISDTIHSVITQTYENWELLIVDDCSSDNSLNIIKDFAELDSRIKYYVNESNCGAAYARNLALANAKGKWIAFLDSDDLWLPQKLEKQVSFMLSNDYNFSYSYYEQIDESSKPLGIIMTGPNEINKRKMFRYDYLGFLTVMYNREIMGDLFVDPKIGNGRNDYALLLKASKICNCYLIKDTLAQYRIRKNSLSHGKFIKLVKYHYELFRISENMGRMRSLYHTIINLFFGFWKKVIYRVKV